MISGLVAASSLYIIAEEESKLSPPFSAVSRTCMDRMSHIRHWDWKVKKKITQRWGERRLYVG